MILGQLRMGARQAKNAPLSGDILCPPVCQLSNTPELRYNARPHLTEMALENEMKYEN